MQETLEIQKLRKRPKGVNAAALALGKKVTKMDSMVDSDNNDPFKGKGGGLLTLEEAKRVSEREQASDGGIESQDSIGTQFSKETRVRWGYVIFLRCLMKMLCSAITKITLFSWFESW